MVATVSSLFVTKKGKIQSKRMKVRGIYSNGIIIDKMEQQPLIIANRRDKVCCVEKNILVYKGLL